MKSRSNTGAVMQSSLKSFSLLVAVSVPAFGCQDVSGRDESPEPADRGLSEECLDRPAEDITVIEAGAYNERYEVTPPGDFHTYDMRGTEWDANQPVIKPIEIEGAPLSGACVVGARVVGQQSRDLTWQQMKDQYDGDAVRFVYKPGSSVGPVAATGLWVDNVEDGFEPVRYSNSAGLDYSWKLSNSYFRYIRDDVIENDACHDGEVSDVLIDNSFTFISSRPGSGHHLDNGTTPVIKVYDSVVHVGSDDLGGRMWKWPGSASSCTPTPELDVRDSVFRVDRATEKMATFPDGTFDNVTVVWLGEGDYPAEVPPGVTVTSDIDVWHQARDAWLDRHGCDATGDACTNLHNPTGDGGGGDGGGGDGGGDGDGGGGPGEVTLSPAADTFVREASATQAHGSVAELSVDASDGGGRTQALMRFDLEEIAAGSTVLEATLTLETTNRGSGASFHRMLVPWTAGATWSSLSEGISANGVEALAGADFSTGSVEAGTSDFDVTDAVQAWVDGEDNNGWVLIPSGGNGWDFYSREGSTPATLTITFE